QRDHRRGVSADRRGAADRGTRRVAGRAVRGADHRGADRPVASGIRRRRPRSPAGAAGLMTTLLLAPVLVPAAAAVVNLLAGWRRWTAALSLVSAVTVLVCGIVLATRVGA